MSENDVSGLSVKKLERILEMVEIALSNPEISAVDRIRNIQLRDAVEFELSVAKIREKPVQIPIPKIPDVRVVSGAYNTSPNAIPYARLEVYCANVIDYGTYHDAPDSIDMGLSLDDLKRLKDEITAAIEIMDTGG